jgi:hypothetical protein
MSWIICPDEKNGLLDIYPGAAAAYSLRNLQGRSGKDSAVVRVRRDNDNAGQDFTATEVSDGTLAAWVGAGNDGFVRTWYDQSGNGNDIAQTTFSKQPKIVDASGSVITDNSRPTIYFNGNGGIISTAVNILTSNSVIDVTQNLSVFAVMSPQADPSTQDAVWSQFSSALNSSNDYVSYGFRDGGYFTRIRTSVNTIGNGFDTNSQSQSLVSDIVDWSTQTNTFAVNGTAGTDLNDGRSAQASSGICLGSRPDGTAYSANIYLQELVLYESDQSTNRAGIEANINAHYSIF